MKKGTECTDYWLLLKIGLSKKEAVSDLMILNTQDSQSLDRSTKEAIIKFYVGNDVVSQRKIEMRPFP